MLNRVVLMGRLTADPEVRHTASNVAVSSFSIAVDRNYTPRGSERQTDFINIVAWRNTAEFVGRYFRKGSLIALEGSIQTRTYTDNQGNNRYVTEVVADQVYFAGSRPNGNGAAAESQTASFTAPPAFDEPAKGTGFSVGDINDFEEIDADDGDLPF